MAGKGFVREVALIFDRAAGKRMREEAEESLHRAGKDGGEALEKEMAKGGKLAAKAATLALQSEFKLRVGRDRKALAEGLIDEKEFERRGRDAARAFNQGLTRDIKKLERGGGLDDAALITLTGKYKRESGGAASAAGGMALVSRAAAPLAGLFAAGAVKNAAAELYEIGTAAEETGSKFATTFAGATPQVQAFLDEWGALAGLNRTAGQEMTATAGAIVQGMGASREASAAFAEQILRAGGDLQSFHNVPIEQTFAALRAGLTGQQEPLMRFGIILDATQAQQRALLDTGKQHKDELTQLELAQARYNLVLEKMGPALGDLARTQHSTANKARALKAEYENFRIELAEQMMPAFRGLVEWTERNQSALKSLASGGVKFVIGAFATLYRTTLWLGNAVNTVLLGSLAAASVAFVGFAKAAALAYRAKGALLGLFNQELGDRARAEAAEMDALADAVGRFARASATAAKASARDVKRYARETFSFSLPQASAADAAGAAGAPPPLGMTGTGQGGKPETAAQRRARTERAQKGREEEQRRLLKRQIEFEKALRTPMRAEAPGVRGAGRSGSRVLEAMEREREQLMAFRDRWREDHALLEGVAQSAAQNVAEAWERAFALMIEGGHSAGEVITGLGRGMAGALIGGLQEIARSKVAENIARAFESFALSFGAAGIGNVAGSAALQRAGAGHLLAAAKWGLVGAVAGAAGGAVSGGGGAGGAYHRGGEVFGGRAAERAERVGPEVHVYVDGIDPSNPRHQQLTAASVQQATERYGAGGRVTVHPRVPA